MAKICVPVCVSHVTELSRAFHSASEDGDVVELRLDCLPEAQLSQAGDEVRQILKTKAQQLILTLRPAEQGGRRAIAAQDRLYFRLQNSDFTLTADDFWDLELDLALLLQNRAREGNDINDIVGSTVCDWQRTICSYHDFVGVPADLEEIYASMAATKARILKIAVQVDDALECLKVFNLITRAHAERREIIAIAMGDAGVMTRILGPSRGSFLTYASLDEKKGTAPGQTTASELRNLYRIDQIDLDTEVLGIMGHPVVHSLSPYIHNSSFGGMGLNAVYIPFEVRDAVQFIRRMIHPKTREIDWKFKGLSVTAPHKSMVMQCLDWIDPASLEIGAVNTIVAHDDELHGYNTDALAFIKPLRNAFGAVANAKCAIVGAGGAARAGAWALKNEGAQVTIFARDKTKGELLADSIGAECEELSVAPLNDFDIVINATPLGTLGARANETAVMAHQLRGVRLAYDLVYNPAETRFIREARAAGCEVLGGIEMLLAQAVEQFKIWTGQEPNIEVMRTAALSSLNN